MSKIIYLFSQFNLDDFPDLKDAVKQGIEFAMQKNPATLEAIVTHAQDLGIKVRFENFPKKLSGMLIQKDGEKHIFLNKKYSKHHLIHTMRHELAHHFLNHAPPADPHKELQANIFALFLFLGTNKNLKNMEKELNQNPELRLYFFGLFAMVMSIVVAGAVWEIGSWLSRTLKGLKND